MANQNKISSQVNLYWFYLAGFFLILFLPLLIFPPWFIPIGWGKTIVFRIIFSILIFLFISQLLINKGAFERIKDKVRSVSLPFWTLTAFLAIYTLATIFSLDKNFSLWGDPLRSGGFINFSFYILFAVLTFLIIRQKDWQKIWDFSIIIGVFVSIVCIFQQFSVYNKFFIPVTFRPVGTIGNAIPLAIYLLLLTFVSLSFLIKSRNLYRKIFYSFSFLLFIFVSLFLSQTRAVAIGLVVGFLWFLFFYPKGSKKIKTFAAILLMFIIVGAYSAKVYLDSHLYIYQRMPSVISSTVDRTLSIFEANKIMGGRLSVWKVSLEALKERPILGWGPENFIIAFDKHYDASLPSIGPSASGATFTQWWDRAHNFTIDIAVSGGIPASIIYLAFFAIIILQLQRAKREKPENAIISHGIQATFFGYMAANFFGFDTFDTYIISFLLFGYSLHLISSSRLVAQAQTGSGEKKDKSNIQKSSYYNRIVLAILFILLICFGVAFNYKPLKAAKELNIIISYSENKKCEVALKEIENSSSRKTIIDNYLRTMYATIIYDCTDEKIKSKEEFAKDAIRLTKKNVESDPAFLQNWLTLGEYTNLLIEDKTSSIGDSFIQTEEAQQLKNEANYYFEQAALRSPKRQEVYKEWLKTFIDTEDYKEAERKAQKCIDLNPNFGPCYWLLALTYGYQKDFGNMDYFMNLAKEKNYNISSAESLPQLVNMYIKIGYYQNLPEPYLKLIDITPDPQKKAQLYASLAAVYSELGQIDKARAAASKILDLIPFFPEDLRAQAKADVEAFLQSLK